jgi:hypothetical protein
MLVKSVKIVGIVSSWACSQLENGHCAALCCSHTASHDTDPHLQVMVRCGVEQREVRKWLVSLACVLI